MLITLAPIDAHRFPSWQERSHAEYKADLIASGEEPEVTDRHARDSLQRAFPEGSITASHAVFDLVHHHDGIVGYLWIGRDQSGDGTAWWVWDVVVEAEHRGKGYGRAAMRLAEDHARAKGALTLGLSVFARNDAARGLYASLGYQTTTVKMRKEL